MTTVFKLITRNNKFSFEDMEYTLFRQTPGNYKMVWKTPKSEYSAYVHWDGKEWTDAFDKTIQGKKLNK